jgi:farnesyl diphosphate synthase
MSAVRPPEGEGIPMAAADALRWDAQRLAAWSEPLLARVEAALSRWVGVDAPVLLGDAMRYAVLDGGKRLRPLLVFAASESVGGQAEAALRAACAAELIHAYSLVHDDLPCMDNDVLRRGKPTVHVKFGEADALLAGDALQALAFELLTPEDEGIAPVVQARLCRLLARAAGSQGMAGGQAIDLASVGITLSLAELEQMHRLKTGALLRASVLLGALCGKTPDAAEAAALDAYAAAVGLAFQVVDDVLDATADTTTLGKTAGKDAVDQKPTYVSILGLDESRALAQKLREDAHRALLPFGDNAQRLRELADLIVQRKA